MPADPGPGVRPGRPDASRERGAGGAGRRPGRVPLQQGDAPHLHRRRPPERDHLDARHAGRPPGSALRRGDAHHPPGAGHAPSLVQVRPGEDAPGRGRSDRRGAGRGHAGLHPGGHRQTRGAGPLPLQQGPLHPQVLPLPLPPVPQLQVPPDGQGRPGLRPLHDRPQSDHRRLRPPQLPGLLDQVEQGHRGHVRPMPGDRPGALPPRLLRAAGPAPAKVHARHRGLPRHRLERRRPPPRGAHREARRSLPLQDRAIHGPGDQAGQHRSPVQVAGAHTGRRGPGHGPPGPHVGPPGLRPLRQPSQIREPRPAGHQQHPPGFERRFQNASKPERTLSGYSKYYCFPLITRKITISRYKGGKGTSLQIFIFICKPWKSVIQAYCLLTGLLPKSKCFLSFVRLFCVRLPN